MGTLQKVITSVCIPLMLLNMFGGIVAGVWLAILGKWGIIGWGVASFFISSSLIGFAMAPGLLFAIPAIAFHEKGIKVGFYLFSFLGALYMVVILTVWCMGVLDFFIDKADAGSLYATLLWSYGVATGPLSYLTNRETQSGGGTGATVATCFAQVGYVVTVVASLIFQLSFVEMIVVFSAVMFVALCVLFYAAIEATSEHERMPAGQ